MTVGEAYFLHERTWDPCLLSSQIARKPHFGCVPVPARGNSEIEISSRQHSGSTALRSVQVLPNLERSFNVDLRCDGHSLWRQVEARPRDLPVEAHAWHRFRADFRYLRGPLCTLAHLERLSAYIA